MEATFGEYLEGICLYRHLPTRLYGFGYWLSVAIEWARADEAVALSLSATIMTILGETCLLWLYITQWPSVSRFATATADERSKGQYSRLMS